MTHMLPGSTHSLTKLDGKGLCPWATVARAVNAMLSATLILGALLWADTSEGGLALYVATDGNDDWSGLLAAPNIQSNDGPFATLERGRDEIRKLRREGKLGDQAVTIFLRAGIYHRTDSFVLESQDSGTEKFPVTYRAFPGEIVRIVGGISLDPSWFESVPAGSDEESLPEAAVSSVRMADLHSHNITDYGTLTTRGMGRPVYPAALELFFNRRPMPLARWPNSGWALISGVPNERRKGGEFEFANDRLLRWVGNEEIWLHGFWTHDWADSYERVKSIDPQRHLIKTQPPHGVYGYTTGRRFRVLNLLSELDEPGEWYLNRQAGQLYFWPPTELSEGEIYISLLEEPLMIIEDVRHLIVRDIIFEITRGAGISVTDGFRVLIAGCTLTNIGTTAISFAGGREHTITASNIFATGNGGVWMSGGDRQTLTPGGHAVTNNHIHHTSRWVQTHTAPIEFVGVGHRAANNLIHDAPHTAIRLYGNDHLIEYNEIHNVCKFTGGGVKLGRDWTERGNIVQYNYFHDIEGSTAHGSKAIHLDDFASGVLMYGNIFLNTSAGIRIGGGRDNIISNNIFIHNIPALKIDDRGIRWGKKALAEDGVMLQRLNEANYQEPPWSTRYPKLVSILSDDPDLPKGNIFSGNVIIGKEWLILRLRNKRLLDTKHNYFISAHDFVDMESMPFVLRKKSEPVRGGFKPIPYARIGLKLDQYRTELE